PTPSTAGAGATPADAASAAAVTAQFPPLGGPLSVEAAAGWDQLLNAKGTLAAAKAHFEAALKGQDTQEAAAVLGLAYVQLIEARRAEAAQTVIDGLNHLRPDDHTLAGLYIDVLEDCVTDLNQAEPAVQALERCSEANPPVASGAVRARAREMAVNLLVMQGQFKAAQELVAKQDFLRSWAIIGPFDNQDKKAQNEVLGPEKGIHFDQAEAGKNGPIHWHAVPAGALPMGRLHGDDLIFPNEQVTMYAATALKIDAAGEYVLRLGCGGGAKVFLDGKQLAEVPFYSSYDFAKATVPMELSAGDHILMVKLGIAEAMARGFEMSAQLCNPAGDPVAVDSSNDPAKLQAAAAAAPTTPPAQAPEFPSGLYGSIDQALAQIKNPATKAAASPCAQPACQAALLTLKATLMASRNIGNPEDADDQVVFDQATKLAPDSLWVNFLACQHARKRNVAILAARKVLAADPAAAGATQEILSRQDDAGLLQTAEQKARALLQAGQGDAGLWQTIVADALNQRQDAVQARQVLNSAVEYRPLDVDLWLKHWNSLDTDSERETEAQRALHYLGGNPAVLETIAAWDDAQFHADQAADLVQHALTIDPQSQRLLRLAVDYNLRAGKPDAALALVDDALKIAPGHPQLLQEKGELLRRMHPTDEAVKKQVIDLFNQSLAAKPENANLREYVALLEGKTDDWYKPYDLTAAQIKALIVPPDKFADYPTDNSVVLLDQEAVRVNENGTQQSMVHSIQQILQPQAIQKMQRNGVAFNADRESVKVLRAVVYDAQGNEIGHGQVHDGQRHSGADAAGRMYDEGYTATVVTFTKLDVGCVVDFQYLRKDTQEGLYGNYFADMWYMGNEQPTRLSQYILDLPADRKFYMKSLREKIDPVDLPSSGPGRKVVMFERKDIPGLQHETNMEPTANRLPFIQISTFSDWNDVGKWFWQMAKDQLSLDNDKLQEKVAEITKNAKTPLDKLKAINNAVIQDIHYVGIELGRNGYKPHRADQTLESKMGDCKDSATLIAAMCKLAGIKAKLVLIRTVDSGENPKDALAAPDLFNHCIAYVPDCDGKAYWVDGTTNDNGLGEVPPSDQGANVLLVDDQGGTWATIPRSPGSDNGFKTDIDVTMNPDGSGAGHVRIDYTGFFQQWYRSSQEQPEKVKLMMEGLIGRTFPKATLTNLKTGNPKDLLGPVFYEFDFQAPNVGTRIDPTDLALTVEPHPWNWSQRYANEPTRKDDLWVRFQYTIAEKLVLHLPKGATVKSKPQDEDLKTPEAAYIRKVTQDGQTVTVTKSASVLEETIKVAQYPEFKKWANSVDELENDSLTIAIPQ
ncbi:MAG: DUF3857 domain-containing protein, partial [Planctomycetota bacterium]